MSIGDPHRILAFLERCGLGLVLDGHCGDVVRVLESVSTQVSESPITRLVLAAAALHSGDVTSATTCLDLLEATHPPIAEDPLFLAMSLEISCVTATSDNEPLAARLERRQKSTHSDIEAYAHMELATAHLLRCEFDRATVEYTQAVALGTIRGRARFVLKSLTGLGYVASLSGDIGAMRSHSVDALDYAVEHRITTTAEYELSASVAAFATYLCASSELPYRIPTIGNYRSTDVLGASAPVFGWHSVVTFGLHSLDGSTDRRSDRRRCPRRDAQRDRITDLRVRDLGFSHHPSSTHAFPSARWNGQRELCVTQPINSEKRRRYISHGVPSPSRPTSSRKHSSKFPKLSGPPKPRCSHITSTPGHSKPGSTLQQVTSASRFRSPHKALRAAEAGSLLRPFLDYGASLRPVFDEFSGHFGDQEAFAEQVRSRIRPQELVSAPILTPGEYTVLRELASGDTTESIADTLFLSVNTIKTHLRRIYRKLEVSNRRDALKAARRGGLI